MKIILKLFLVAVLVILGRLPRKQRLSAHFDWAIAVRQKPPNKGVNVLELKITNEQQVTVHLNPRTEEAPKGKPAKLDGKPEWKVNSGDSTIQPSQDGMACTIVSSDTPGVTEVLVSADADLGQGVVTISDLIQVTVDGAMAKSLGLVADAPIDKPDITVRPKH